MIRRYGIVAFSNGTITVVANAGKVAVALPAAGTVVLASGADGVSNTTLAPNSAVWLSQ